MLDNFVKLWIILVEYFYVCSYVFNLEIDINDFWLRVIGMDGESILFLMCLLRELDEYIMIVILICVGNCCVEFNEEGEVGGV